VQFSGHMPSTPVARVGLSRFGWIGTSLDFGRDNSAPAAASLRRLRVPTGRTRASRGRLRIRVRLGPQLSGNGEMHPGSFDPKQLPGVCCHVCVCGGIDPGLLRKQACPMWIWVAMNAGVLQRRPVGPSTAAFAEHNQSKTLLLRYVRRWVLPWLLIPISEGRRRDTFTATSNPFSVNKMSEGNRELRRPRVGVASSYDLADGRDQLIPEARVGRQEEVRRGSARPPAPPPPRGTGAGHCRAAPQLLTRGSPSPVPYAFVASSKDGFPERRRLENPLRSP